MSAPPHFKDALAALGRVEGLALNYGVADAFWADPSAATGFLGATTTQIEGRVDRLLKMATAGPAAPTPVFAAGPPPVQDLGAVADPEGPASHATYDARLLALKAWFTETEPGLARAILLAGQQLAAPDEVRAAATLRDAISV